MSFSLFIGTPCLFARLSGQKDKTQAYRIASLSRLVFLYLYQIIQISDCRNHLFSPRTKKLKLQAHIISEAEAEAIAQSQGMTANTLASPDRGDDHPRHLQEETTHDWAVHAP